MKNGIIIVFVLFGMCLTILLMRRQIRGAVVTLTPGVTFPWYKGTTLTAMEAATIILPGAILPDETKIGEIIRASDDNMEIGFTPKEGASGFETIILKFQKGQAVTLARSSDAMLVEEAKQTKTFRKTGK